MIRIGVIGVGSLGKHHARIYDAMRHVDLTCIVDTDIAAAKKIGKKYKAEYFKNYHGIVEKVDAVSIAAPTPFHYEIAKFFLEHKIHVLVEKPITVSVEEADDLILLAEKNKVILQVGHIERFNPAVVEAQKHIKDARFIEINRLGPYSPRCSNVGVVLDLMVHDLDMVLFLTDSKPVSIDAVGASVMSQTEDIANVRIRFKNSCVANISASRVSLERFRKFRIFQHDSYLSLDYEKQSLKMYSKREGVEKIETLKDILFMKIPIKKEEPLYLELKDFIECIEQNTFPKVSGVHGRDALKLALDITEQIRQFSSK
ncbi:Gfo/Idh/MocA family oxidoreductase [bacterium]